MAFSSISNSKLHCCLVILILIILVFLSLPLLLIYVANSRFEETWKSQNATSVNVTCPRKERSHDGSPVQCSDGAFACPSCPEICILQHWVCDGSTDCPDRWDESVSVCYDSSGLLGTYFQSILDKNDDPPTKKAVLAKPESCSLDDFYMEQCKCNLSEPNVIICEGLGMRTIPINLKETVFKIRVRNNSVDSVDGVDWPHALVSLVLIHNQITKIGPGAFKSAPSLSRLYLAHNNITEIDDDAFESLTSLTSLQVESNQLTTFRTRVLRHTPAMIKIWLHENLIDLPDDTQFSLSPGIKEIWLDNNRISKIKRTYFSNMPRLMWLSLTHNEISYIESDAFDGNYDLLELNLSFNKIKVIERRIFAHRLNIQRLLLSGNPISEGGLTTESFRDVMELTSLNLTQIEFTDLKRETFSYLRHLRFIYFEKFRYCHYATQVPVCRPITDGLSSIEELLAFPILKYAVWIVAMVCSLGNVFVFVWRSISPHEDRTLSLFIKNLSIADLMMGAYLSTIGWQDWKFQNNFRNNAIEWMSSWKCSAIGFLAILSSELSVFILLIITIERYRSIMSIHRLEEAAQKRRAKTCVALAWLFSFLIAFYPLFQWLVRKSDFYATNGLCLPLHIDQPFTQGWQYSAFIYLGVNFIAVLVIIGLYAHMYTMIVDSRQTSRPAVFKAEKREDAILAIRFFFIVVTDCLCWIPIVVIKIMALFDVNISASIYGWLVVFIIPINSALNPIVYTLAAPTTLRSAVCRAFERVCFSIDRFTTRASGYSSVFTRSGRRENNVNGRRRRKMDSNSTATCDTFNTSMTSHSKISFDSTLLEHSSTEPQVALHQHQFHFGHSDKHTNKPSGSKESSFSSTASSSPLKAAVEVDESQIGQKFGVLSSKLGFLTGYKRGSVKHRVLLDPDKDILGAFDPLAAEWSKPKEKKKISSLSDRIENITVGFRSSLQSRQSGSHEQTMDSEDKLASNLIEQSASTSSSERGSSRSSSERPDFPEGATTGAETEAVVGLTKKTRARLTDVSVDEPGKSELDRSSETDGVDQPRPHRTTKSSIVHFEQDQ